MGKLQKQWAREKRAELMAQLGNQCAICGAQSDLTFDCIIPMGDTHHKFDTSARMSFYRAQHKANNLQVLCAACNSSKGNAPTTRTHLIRNQIKTI